MLRHILSLVYLFLHQIFPDLTHSVTNFRPFYWSKVLVQMFVLRQKKQSEISNMFLWYQYWNFEHYPIQPLMHDTHESLAVFSSFGELRRLLCNRRREDGLHSCCLLKWKLLKQRKCTHNYSRGIVIHQVEKTKQ